MEIREKIRLDRQGLEEHGPITIVAFGDSVTHGCFTANDIDYEVAYWNRLKKKINAVHNYVPVNVINAGIGGITAGASLARMDKQVLAHNPDLVIVCFGLNDVNGPLESYISALREIFGKCQAAGTQVIFLTPNMLNTYVADWTAPQHVDYAHVTAKMQNEGKMDRYMAAAVELAQDMGVAVCDCYAKWKKLAETEDTTKLLCNGINHPTKEMHELFAQSLFEMLFPEKAAQGAVESGMYKE